MLQQYPQKTGQQKRLAINISSLKNVVYQYHIGPLEVSNENVRYLNIKSLPILQIVEY